MKLLKISEKKKPLWQDLVSIQMYKKNTKPLIQPKLFVKIKVTLEVNINRTLISNIIILPSIA